MGSKRKSKKADEAPDLLQIMVISLFIILLAFFILLNSIAVIDDQKKLGLLDSLLGTFGVLTGGKSMMEGQGSAVALTEADTHSSHVNFSDLMVGNEEILERIRVRSDKRGTVLSIPADMLFDKWGASLTPSGEAVLSRLSKTLSKNEGPVEILGHTDNRPPMVPGGVSNRELSSLRAMAVLTYILGKGTYKKDRFAAYGWGEYQPIVTNRTRESRELNRRMDIVFVHDPPAEAPRGIFTFKNFFFKVFD